MGNNSSRNTLFGKDFDKFEKRIREDSDYVTLVRVVPNQNPNPNQNLSPPRMSTFPELRPTSSLPLRPKSLKVPNVYSDLREYLRPKSSMIISSKENESNAELEDIALEYSNNERSRPISFSNHCSSRCVCNDCRLTRFHLLNWLLPNCTRTNAERLLIGRPEGTFLIRKSEKFPGQYTLSFVCGGSIRHCLVLRSVYGFGLKEPYKYSTLQQFVLHYSSASLSEFNWKLNTTLKYPVFG